MLNLKEITVQHSGVAMKLAIVTGRDLGVKEDGTKGSQSAPVRHVWEAASQNGLKVAPAGIALTAAEVVAGLGIKSNVHVACQPTDGMVHYIAPDGSVNNYPPNLDARHSPDVHYLFALE